MFSSILRFYLRIKKKKKKKGEQNFKTYLKYSTNGLKHWHSCEKYNGAQLRTCLWRRWDACSRELLSQQIADVSRTPRRQPWDSRRRKSARDAKLPEASVACRLLTWTKIYNKNKKKKNHLPYELRKISVLHIWGKISHLLSLGIVQARRVNRLAVGHDLVLDLQAVSSRPHINGRM